MRRLKEDAFDFSPTLSSSSPPIHLPPQNPKPPKPMTLPSSAAAGECNNCATHDVFPLHNVRVRGILRRVCTSCVLILHRNSFCPSCFSLYESNPPPPSKRLTCSACSSYTHSHCASPSTSSPFRCQPCADPNFSFFRLPDNRAIDKKLASVLLCAAKIAAASMAKAAVIAKTEAEKRVKDAAYCRKRAREALENVVVVSGKDKVGCKSSKEVESSVEVSGSATANNNLRRSSVEGSGLAVVKSTNGSNNGNVNLGNFHNGGGQRTAQGLHSNIKEDPFQNNS